MFRIADLSVGFCYNSVSSVARYLMVHHFVIDRTHALIPARAIRRQVQQCFDSDEGGTIHKLSEEPDGGNFENVQVIAGLLEFSQKIES